jgi:hypothetical protein
MPGDPNKPLQAPSDLGQPAGPMGHHLDANGQWVDDDPATQAANAAANGSPQPGQGGVASGVNYNPRTGMSSFDGGATTGQIQDPYAWGGTSGAVVVGPDGKPAIDTSQSGRQQDVNRLRGMGAGMANRQAYQLDYGKGNVDRAQGQADRTREAGAVARLANAAKGGAPSAAVIGSQGAMDDAFGSQLAAQGGARNVTQGGAASVAGSNGAMAGQLAATGGLGAQRSGELMGDRTAYAGAAGALRTGDYGQQSLDQQRAKAQYESEIGQRQLNDQGRRQAEDLAFGVNQKAMEAGQAETDRATGNYATSLQRQTNQADRAASLYNGAINQAGKMMPSGGGGGDDDPNKDNG